MNLKHRQSALLLALGLVLVASPAASGLPAAMVPAQAQLSLDALLTATTRSATDKQAVEALVAGLRDTVRFLKQKPAPSAAVLPTPRFAAKAKPQPVAHAGHCFRVDTVSSEAVVGGRLNLPPPLA